jgi:D-galactarolactone cycloisomerase
MPRIARIRAHVLEAPLSEPFAWSFTETSTRGSCVVEVTTEDGLSGWGEYIGPARLNAALIPAYARMLVGQDALAVDRHWLAMYNGLGDQGMKGLALTALSGVDVALWDLRGRHWGEPVWRLMGGRFHDRVAAYATGTYRRGDGWRTLEARRTAARFGGGDPDALTLETLQYLVDEVAGYAAEGFRAAKLKIGFGVDQDVALIRAVREAVGPRVGLMLDANHGYDAIDAIRLGRAVADQDIGWFEEPVVPDDLDSYVEVRRAQPIPVAGGETEFTRWGFREVLTRRAMDIVQPDSRAGAWSWSVEPTPAALARGNCRVNLSAAYETSRSGGPRSEDVGALAAALVRAAPERLLWASNWPHPSAPTDALPDDADLLEVLLEWAPREADRLRMLVDDPGELYGFGPVH